MMTDNTKENLNVECKVVDPQHHGEGRSRYTSYLIRVTGKGSTRRRYSDFQWLYNKLLEEKAGAIIPIIPHQRAITQNKRFSEELVQERLQQLNIFMQKVMNHPELSNAECLHSFLTADATQWAIVKKDDTLNRADPNDPDNYLVDTPSTPSAGKKIANFFGKLSSNVVRNIALGAGIELESTPDDDIFQELDAYANQLDRNVKILAKDTTSLAAAHKQQSEALGQMGAAFSEMGQYRHNDVIIRTSSSTMFTKLGKAHVDLGRSVQEMASKSILDDAMQDLVRDVTSLKAAIQRRKDVLYQYTRKAQTGKSKMAQLEKWKENPPADTKKIAQVEQDVKALKEEGLTLWKEVDIVSKRLQRDVERFRLDFHQKMRAAMEHTFRNQIEFGGRYVQHYEEGLPYVEPPPTATAASAPPEKDAVTTML